VREIPVGSVDEPSTSTERDAHIDLANALARLNPDDRALLALRYVAGFDSNELARATGLSPSGTRARLARLLDRMRTELSDD
jgi:RNA polymerase sigma factor (sigma-70 family)